MICASTWYNYFKTLLHDEEAPPLIFEENTDFMNQDASCLNIEITLNEVETAIKNLSNGKCSGLDGIPAEFYKNSMCEILPCLHHYSIRF